MFAEMYRTACGETRGILCVGLDPHLDRLPASYPKTAAGVERFVDETIKRTVDQASAYKPNAAFFEALGREGFAVLERTIERIHSAKRPAILDAKRGDIASTASAYAEAAFGKLKADAITVVPYMGSDAVRPFLDRGGFTFILTLPSNPSAEAVVDHGKPPLYQRVADMAMELEEAYPGQVGLVVGATRPREAGLLHRMAPALPWLVPGIGAQGADVSMFFAETVGHQSMVVNASRAILFAEDPGTAAAELRRTIEELRHV